MTQRLEKDIVEMAKQNESCKVETEAFFPMLAHEVYRLSEIINVSLSNIQKRSASQDPELDFSRRTAARLYYLAEFALMASRTGQSNITANPVLFNIGKSLIDVIEGLVVAYPDADTRIVRSEFSLTNIQADPVLIEFALSNILENALKYGTGDIKVSIEKVDSLENSAILIQVDNLFRAVLLQEEERSSITRISWGIGLALIRQIAKAHGGFFIFENEGPLVTFNGENFREVSAKISLPVAV